MSADMPEENIPDENQAHDDAMSGTPGEPAQAAVATERAGRKTAVDARLLSLRAAVGAGQRALGARRAA